MKICGIVCEYNPFQNGHVYHIQKTREITNCELLLCVMSGNAVQRGEFAIADKWTRAKAAIEAGCDLVIELPYPYVVQRGDRFAHGALRILALAGVQELVFGSESNDLHLLQQMAKDLEKRSTVTQKDISYAKALENTLNDKLSSNDMLGVFYIQEAKQYGIIPHTLQRTNQYHDVSLHSSIASATAIRKAYLEHRSIQDYTPMKTDSFHEHTWNDYYSYLQMFLATADNKHLASFFLMDEGIENLFKRQIQHPTFDDFLSACISKRYTRTKIQRTLMHLLTQTTKAEINALAPISYLRPLAFNAKGQAYLRTLSKQGITIASRFKDIPMPYRQLEMRSTIAYAYPFDAAKRQHILQRERLSAEVL